MSDHGRAAAAGADGRGSAQRSADGRARGTVAALLQFANQNELRRDAGGGTRTQPAPPRAASVVPDAQLSARRREIALVAAVRSLLAQTSERRSGLGARCQVRRGKPARREATALPPRPSRELIEARAQRLVVDDLPQRLPQPEFPGDADRRSLELDEGRQGRPFGQPAVQLQASDLLGCPCHSRLDPAALHAERGHHVVQRTVVLLDLVAELVKKLAELAVVLPRRPTDQLEPERRPCEVVVEVDRQVSVDLRHSCKSMRRKRLEETDYLKKC